MATRLLPPSLIVFSVLAWSAGGATVDVTSVDEFLEILALPLLLLAFWTWLLEPRVGAIGVGAMAVAGLIALVPVLQLLPLPASVWGMPSARTAISADLVHAGVSLSSYRWSLVPLDTERAFWALMPALACFFAALQLGHVQRRMMSQVVLGLVLANLAFGFFQVGLPPDSSLRLYPGLGSGFSGVLINDNHQATALIIGMLMATGLFANAKRAAREGDIPAWQLPAYALSALVCVAGIIPTTSRAGMILGLLSFTAALFTTGLLPVHRVLHSRRLLAAAGMATLVTMLGLFGAWRWMQVDSVEENRGALARAAVELAQQHTPLGSGVGGFVNAFMQGGSPLALGGEYINHAHNEYAQWWMTGGVLALVAMLAGMLLLCWIGWSLLRTRHRDPIGVACWLAICVVLAHSWVDFPLRTLSLMSLTATLAGLAVASALRVQERRPLAHTGREVAAQRA